MGSKSNGFYFADFFEFYIVAHQRREFLCQRNPFHRKTRFVFTGLIGIVRGNLHLVESFVRVEFYNGAFGGDGPFDSVVLKLGDNHAAESVLLRNDLVGVNKIASIRRFIITVSLNIPEDYLFGVGLQATFRPAEQTPV